MENREHLVAKDQMMGDELILMVNVVRGGIRLKESHENEEKSNKVRQSK